MNWWGKSKRSVELAKEIEKVKSQVNDLKGGIPMAKQETIEEDEELLEDEDLEAELQAQEEQEKEIEEEVPVKKVVKKPVVKNTAVLTKSKPKKVIEVVNELPTQAIKSGTREDGTEVEFETITEALKNIRNDLIEIKAKLGGL